MLNYWLFQKFKLLKYDNFNHLTINSNIPSYSCILCEILHNLGFLEIIFAQQSRREFRIVLESTYFSGSTMCGV